MSSQINETLFSTDESGNIKPLLAKKMTTSANGLISTITLKSGVKFSNGRPMTAKDVVFSIDAARKSLYYSGVYEQITSVSSPNPETVVVKTKQPSPALKANLTLWTSAIVPSHYGGMTSKEFSRHPIGTGPFIFKSWKQSESLTLVANPNYWQPNEPLLKEVVFRSIPENTNRVTQLEGGQLGAIQAPPFAQVPALEQAGLQKSLSPMSNVTVLMMNQNEPLFQDSRIRKAIDLAIDRQGIVDAALSGSGEPAGSFLAPVSTYFDSSLEPPKRDIDEAKELVASAVQDGLDPRFKLLTIVGESYYTAAAQVIQQDLNEVGFDVSIEPLDGNAEFERQEAGEFDTLLTGWGTGPDPSELIGYVIHYILAPSGVNTQQLEKQATAAESETNPAKREQQYFEIQGDIASERNLISLSYYPNVWFTAANLTGFEQPPSGPINLRKAGFTG